MEFSGGTGAHDEVHMDLVIGNYDSSVFCTVENAGLGKRLHVVVNGIHGLSGSISTGS